MSVQKQARIWVITILAAGVLLYLLSDVLLPFVAGLAVAYFLDPVADRLEKWGLPRLAATTIITIIFFILLAAGIILLIPLIGDQFAALIEAVPGYVDRFYAFFVERTDGRFNDLIDQSDELGAKIVPFAANILQNIANRGLALLNLISLLAITPVVSFYLLNDWDRMIAHIDALLPRPYAARIRVISKEIDVMLSGFVRGTGTVCIILAIFYATSLQLAGLEFGLIVGIISGLISFIPFVGMIIGLILSVVLSLFQFLPDQPEMVAVIGAIFIAGQVLEGNFLTPNLVGKNIGLHPVWLIFGLLAFGSLFGFVGMLLSVPIAAAIGVFVRHGIADYLRSTLYQGDGLMAEATELPPLAADQAGEAVTSASALTPSQDIPDNGTAEQKKNNDKKSDEPS